MSTTVRTLASAAVALSAAVLVASPAHADKELHGYWMDSHGEVILEIEACGAAICGKVAWLKKPYGPDGYLLTDYLNSDPALQRRPVCGLRVVEGFEKQPDGTWGNGTVYVSDLGKSFSGFAEVLSPTQVKVTGYVLLPIFGESEVWTKFTGQFPHCERNPPPKRRPGLDSAQAPPAGAAAQPAAKVAPPAATSGAVADSAP